MSQLSCFEWSTPRYAVFFRRTTVVEVVALSALGKRAMASYYR